MGKNHFHSIVRRRNQRPIGASAASGNLCCYSSEAAAASSRRGKILRAPYSHSIVPGGFEVMSYTTRLTPLTSLMMRVATWPMNFMSKG
jgi:hypothetical protein